MNRWSALAVLLAFAGALVFRLPKLDTRPLHNDEAVNAIKIAELWEDGNYRYDPDEYHGPTLHYATLPFLLLSGASSANELPDRTLRLVTVAFGASLVLLLLLFADGLGRHALVWSALFTAISPAMVFYSRYFIHEMLLVFFTALTIGAGWRYAQSRSSGWAILCGAGVGLMFATKETFVLSIAAMTVALAVTLWFEAPRPITLRGSLALVNWKQVALGLAAALVAWLLFFSSFFTNFAGLLDSIRTYFPWLKRAAGDSPHLHPWYFYLQRLGWFHPMKGPIWSEGLVLILALIGGIVGSRRGSPLIRFLTIYTVSLTAIYSIIFYKTPWCLLGFYHGIIILAGVGAAALMGWFKPRSLKFVAIILLLGLSAQLAAQSWRASFLYASDRRNPYVYAQTVPDILNLVKRVEGIAAVSEDGFKTVVKVIAPKSEYWPLPWYLRRFEHIGWYDALPEDPFSPIIIVSSQLDARLDDKSERKWIMAGINELRPGVFFELYVHLPLWARYVESLPPEPE